MSLGTDTLQEVVCYNCAQIHCKTSSVATGHNVNQYFHRYIHHITRALVFFLRYDSFVGIVHYA